MKINRRNFLATTGLGTLTVGLGSLIPAAAGLDITSRIANQSNEEEEDGPVLSIGDGIAIADTEYGKVQGYILNDVYTFLGIRYGADTGGKNRFMPPQKPEPWEGIKPAVFYGDTAPQRMEKRFPNDYNTFVDNWNYYDVSEDCLFLNIWTPAIADGKKRPVLVWLHGGGYTNGNAIEQDGYHGENISKYGDIVFCSLNHRLGPIGYSDLSAVSNKHKDSGNVGMLDIIAALEWVNRNIENFGGDPTNVTIMGQSGGGSKVCTIAAMPAAKGLIHKGVPLSGSAIEASDQEITRKIGTYILKEAGLTADQAEKLQEIPWREYLDIADRAARKCLDDMGTNIRRTFGPVADGIHIPKGTFYVNNADGKSPQIPMLFCTTFHEWIPTRHTSEYENMTLADVVQKITPQYGEKAQSIAEAYSKTFPHAKPVEVWALILSSRKGVVTSANAKLKEGQPVYMAWFGWCPPLFNNRIRAFHCLDISFWFRNTDRIYTHTGGGAKPRKLANKMSDALLSFMHTGNPNGADLPQWPLYTEEKGEVMILDNECFVADDPDKEARKLL